MADQTIERRITNPAGGFDLGTSQAAPIIPVSLSFKMSAINSFSLELVLGGIAAGDAAGSFQILVSNDNLNWYAVPGAVVAISGTTRTRYFIFAGTASGIATAQYVNLNYVRTSGTGKLTNVIMSYISS